jgi:hypothetical protein
MHVRRRRVASAALALAILILGCAGPQPSRSVTPNESPASTSRPTAPKRIVLGLAAEVTVLSETARQGGPSGSAVMQELLNAGPAVVDEQGILHPQLA